MWWHRTLWRQASSSHTKPFTNLLTLENIRLASLYLFYKTHTYINRQNHKLFTISKTTGSFYHCIRVIVGFVRIGGILLKFLSPSLKWRLLWSLNMATEMIIATLLKQLRQCNTSNSKPQPFFVYSTRHVTWRRMWGRVIVFVHNLAE